MFWRWRNKLKWDRFEFFASSPLLRVRSWLHSFKGHCEQKTVRDDGVIYVAGHPLLNRRCTRLPGCIRLRNDLWLNSAYLLTSFSLVFNVCVFCICLFVCLLFCLHTWKMLTMIHCILSTNGCEKNTDIVWTFPVYLNSVACFLLEIGHQAVRWIICAE